MSYPINYPTPQGANVQIFQEGGSTSAWVKPQGASFVWFTLLGAGGGGDTGSTGGGSGAVTNFMGPAFLMPDSLQINVGAGGATQVAGGNTSVFYALQNTSSPYLLLQAKGGLPGSSGGGAMSANYFTAMGFFQSTAGQDGTTGTQSASSTTFLSGGGLGTPTANYGYKPNSQTGYFQMQPIIVGIGGSNSSSGSQVGGVGCGGGVNGAGGNGLVVIITW
jgi:hypothetical protein